MATLSWMVTSAPRLSSARITSMCLCSAAQMLGVQPPLSCKHQHQHQRGQGPRRQEQEVMRGATSLPGTLGV